MSEEPPEDLNLLPPLSTLQERTYHLLAGLSGGQDQDEAAIRSFLKEDNLRRPGFELPKAGVGWTWFNVDRPLSVPSDFSGRLVLLDFFTYCCVNCLHVLPDLRRVEEEFSDKEKCGDLAGRVLVVGVHSAKFDNERVDDNIADACRRYDIRHPVVNDAAASWWRQLGVSCWPTVVALDPVRSWPIAVFVGESHIGHLSAFARAALSHYSSVTSSLPSPPPLPPPPPVAGSSVVASLLRYPGKVCVDADAGTVYVADSGNHRIVAAELDGGRVLAVAGGVGSGFRDGRLDESAFNAPQGVCLGPERDDGSGRLLYVADTENHAVRSVDWRAGVVATVARRSEDVSPGEQDISSPWDVCVGSSPGSSSPDDTLYVAMAGCHQIWAAALRPGRQWRKKGDGGADRAEGECFVVAGTGKEENRNNSYPNKASFAQPSGLSWDGGRGLLFVADSESSSVRVVDVGAGNGAVRAVCGGDRDPMNLFSYGDVDGIGVAAKLQHPLGVAADPRDGVVYVADSYNHKIKKIVKEGKSYRCTALPIPASTFLEPGGIALDVRGNRLVVADTNHHAVKTVDLDTFDVRDVRVGGDAADAVDAGDGGDVAGESRRVALAPGVATLTVLTAAGLALNREAPNKWKSAGADGKWGRFDADGKAQMELAPPGGRVEVSLYLCRDADGACTVKKLWLDVAVGQESDKKELTLVVGPDGEISIQ